MKSENKNALNNYLTRGQKPLGDDSDSCMCRQRACDAPKPANGGADCAGAELQVANCTVHGEWTQWSAWSGCSKTCDLGMRQRKRVCGNPAPAYGGRKCVGQDTDTSYCDNLPPCAGSASSNSLVRYDSSASADRWTDWSEWSPCSVECGVGFRYRRRKCYGSDCLSGCDRQYEECEGSKKCSDKLVVTDWTPWMKTNASAGSSWYEKRFRFSYVAPVALNQVGEVSDEQRYCTGPNQCSVMQVRGQDSSSPTGEDWSEWSKCTRECGGGYQVRIRDGRTTVERACNTHSCQGSWSCWSEWSTTCESDGKKRRSRECRQPGYPEGSQGITCEGGSSYEEMDCDGWGAWGEWSVCEKPDEGTQTRYRACLTDRCRGEDAETRECGSLVAVTASVGGANAVLGSGFIGFLLGTCVGGALVYYFFVFRKAGSGAHGTPHYVSAKSQNLYVSLPMLDLRHHNKGLVSNASDCGTLRSTTTAGTLRSTKGGSSSIYNGGSVNGVKDYETATIKRSHSHRNSSLINTNNMRADLDSDQMFQ